MKHLARILALTLLLSLTACAGREIPPEDTAAAPPPAETVENPTVEGPAKDEPEAEAEAGPAAQEAPDQQKTPPVQPESAPLPDPVYCHGGAAIAPDGQILFQVPDRILTPLRDVLTGETVAVLAAEDSGQPPMYTAAELYDQQGWILLKDLTADAFCYGNLICYKDSLEGWTVRDRISGEILQSDLANVFAAGPVLCLDPVFWNAPGLLLDQGGNLVAELERGFQVKRSLCWEDRAYILVSAPDDTQNLIDPQGNPCLERFHDFVSRIEMGCAIVRDGETWQAIDLQTQEVVFQRDQSFTLLPDSVLLHQEDGTVVLADRQGKPLLDETCHSIIPWAPVEGQAPQFLLAHVIRSDRYCTLLLDFQGTVLQEIPADPLYVTPLGGGLIYYSDSKFQNSKYWTTGSLLDLADGSTLTLFQADRLWMEPIETEDQVYLLFHYFDENNQQQHFLALPDGTTLLEGSGACTYVGGRVLSTDRGLVTLEGQWLYTGEVAAP